MRTGYGAQLLRGFVAVSLAVVLAAALQRALVGLGVLDIRGEPLGQARFSWLGLGAVPALFACGSIFFAGSVVGRVGKPLAGSRSAGLLPAAGALFMVAGFLAYDPFYLPNLRRFSEEGLSGWWIASVALLCSVACIAVLRAGRAGLALGGAALWLGVLAPLSVGWH